MLPSYTPWLLGWAILMLLLLILLLHFKRTPDRSRSNAKPHAKIILLNTAPSKKAPTDWELQAMHYTLGRRSSLTELDLSVCHDKSISRLHAMLRYDGWNYHLIPFSRTDHSGLPTLTFVNGTAVGFSGVVLHSGDTIRLGRTDFRFLDDSFRPL